MTATSPAFPDERFEGRLSFVSPVVDEASREFRVKARLPNPDGQLKPGAFATAHVTLATRTDRPVVPEECLVSLRQTYAVFAVADGVAHRRDVTIGLRQAGLVEIRAGLEPGAQVVRTGHMRLTDGDAVRVVDGDEAQSSAATWSAATRPAATQPAATQPVATQPASDPATPPAEPDLPASEAPDA